jgi:hypothetical protein
VERAAGQAATEAARSAEVANMEPAANVGGSLTDARAPPAPRREDQGAESAGAPAARNSTGESPASSARFRDTVDLGTTSITGNQELPKVLYIVPWKRSDLGDLVGRPANTLLDEVLAPVDPEEFERHLSYYQILYGDSSSGVTATGRSEEE